MGIDDFIKVEHVSRTFEEQDAPLKVLDDISFSMAKGELTCLLGASGCGKSTLLRAIAGLDTEHEGSITVGGKPVLKPEKTRGIVFQEHRLFPWLTVEQNVAFALNGVDKKEKARLVQKYIDLVDLTGFEKTYPGNLSGGMAQRAGIARALVNQPETILLDEPFGALDAFTKISMQEELKKIQKRSGVTTIVVTHDIEEAVFLADTIIILSSRPGKIRRIVRVTLPEPRDRNSDEFTSIKRDIYGEFFDIEQLP